MDKFKPGDKITSSLYGPGTVTGYSATDAPIVLVRYAAERYDCAYDERTGRRMPRFGSDTIRHEEVSHGD